MVPGHVSPYAAPAASMAVRILFVLAATAGLSPASVAQPSTDIFLVPVDGADVGRPRRITDREGYDNQPRFLPGGNALVYASWRDGGTDIMLHDLRTGATRALVDTPQSEYSPTPIPGRDAISLVRDYGDLKQQLWSFPLDGGKPELLLPDVNPVGYHAWIDEQSLILFVLGEPHTLQRARVGPGSGTVLVESPGRALASMPDGSAMSFVDKSEAPDGFAGPGASDARWWLSAIDPLDGTRRRLIATPAGREDYAWAPDGTVWIGDDSRLYRRTPEDDRWHEVADLDPDGIYGITRLTFSPDGRSLALVGNRAPADLAAAYREPAGRILGAALTDVEGWAKLDHLATVIGHRLSGSAALEQAIEWAAASMESEGLTVRKQSVMVPRWVRGAERARLIAPVERELRILGLGDSVGTPAAGIRAPVLVVRGFDELEAMGRSAVEGKIVLYAVEWDGYGATVQYRGHGASRAAALGAVAVLVRSATGRSLSTPHTGALRYDEAQPKIPAAAVTVEDAMWMRRLADKGQQIVVQLQMEARMLEESESFNVIAEIPGSERPEEVVVMGGHYDSWDVGQGVHDDGAACIAAWQALRLIDRLGLQPRRTLRVVLWTNEENGLRGGKAYHAALSETQVADHVAALEMDGGCERPTGWGFGIHGIEAETADDPDYESALLRMQQIGTLLESIDADAVFRGGGGADIGPLMRAGVPGMGLRTVGEHYFDWHHTDADTLDKVEIDSFRKAIALLGVTGFVLADMPERLVPRKVP